MTIWFVDTFGELCVRVRRCPSVLSCLVLSSLAGSQDPPRRWLVGDRFHVVMIALIRTFYDFHQRVRSK